MAGPNFTGLDKGYLATTAVRQFRAVVDTANESMREATTLGERCVGFCQEEVSAQDATDGRIANVRMQGISRAIAGNATPVRGARVASDAQGRVVIAATGHIPIGIVRSAPAVPVAGDHVDVELVQGLPAAL